VQEITALCTRLDEALASDVLRHVSEPTFLPLSSPTLHRREGYREVLQAWLNFAMAAKLVWHGGEQVFGAGQRDVATLYEYWVFFKLLNVVAKVFKLDKPANETLLEPTADGFGLKLKAGKFMALQGRSDQPGRKLEVQFSYNRSFRATQTPRVPGSWTENLRPDYTLSLWPVGFSAEQAELRELMVHVHFDAKYRIDQVASLLNEAADTVGLDDTDLASALDVEKQAEARGSYKRADLLKMHAYRDAIRRTQGAYVIYPGQAGADKRLESFHEVLPGLGAFALRPGMGTTVLESFLRDVVSHVADRASAREQHSFHTWQTYESAVANTAQVQREAYSVVSEKAAGSQLRAAPLRETFVVVGATYLLLHGDGDKAVPGLFRILHPQDGPVVHSKASLQAMGYPSTPTQEAYLVFEVASADDYSGVAWDYAALPNKPADAALGHPFAVTLQDLLLVSMRQPSH